MRTCALWWEGPSFLKLGEEAWSRLADIDPHESTFAELTKTSHAETHVLASVSGQPTYNLDNIIDCQKFSNLGTLLQVTSQVLRFVELVKGKPLDVLKVSYTLGLLYTLDLLEARELDRAETLWIHSIQ